MPRPETRFRLRLLPSNILVGHHQKIAKIIRRLGEGRKPSNIADFRILPKGVVGCSFLKVLQTLEECSFKTFKTFNICVHLCMHEHAYTGACMYMQFHAWRSEGNFGESVLSFHHEAAVLHALV